MIVSIKQAKPAAAERKQARATFEATKLDAAQKSIHVFAGIVSIGNFLFLVCDMYFIHGQVERLIAGVFRYCFSILLILLVRKLQHIRSFGAFSAAVTVLEALEIVLFFSVLWMYDSPNFMIQSVGLILTILVIFTVPNRSANMLVLSLTASTAYFLITYFIIDAIEPREYIAAVVYTVLAIIVCAVKTIGNDRYAQQEYFERTRLEQTSTRDFLTQAATRERLEEEARRWMNFCRRQSLPLCLVFVDVDDLKRINDRYGHAMGDVALKEIAGLMHTQLRNSDTIARWGGDEFVLLLPNVTLQNALLLLDRVKSAVNSLTLDGGVTVSCSFGVVQMGAQSTYAELLAEADAMMYRAKNAGKGKISYPNAYIDEKK